MKKSKKKMNAIEKFIEEMDEWDTVFDPTDKPEYSHAQLVRFAELWAKKQLEEYGERKKEKTL